jgi:hypothetical protein
MRRAVSAILSTVLLAAFAAPAALASVAPAAVRPCCMRGAAHHCLGTTPAAPGDRVRSANCVCGACERTLTSSAARVQSPQITGQQAPKHSFVEEFYPAPDTDQSTAAKPERAPPVAQQ